MTILNAEAGTMERTTALVHTAKFVEFKLKSDSGNPPVIGTRANPNWYRKTGDQPQSIGTITPKPQQNHLLASLSTDVQNRLLPNLELVSLELGKVLYNAGDALRYVYFPTSSIISLLSVMQSGDFAEISMIGKEGVIGISSFMGGERISDQAMVLSTGHAYRLHVQHFRDECNRGGEMFQLMLRYTQALLIQMAQTAACNRHHSIHQQLCQWLLTALDRLPTNQMAMTQQQIADMLGVRREGVTNAAGKLQKLGVIKYNRGHITVLNREKLEEWSCECYSMVKKQHDLLLPYCAPR